VAGLAREGHRRGWRPAATLEVLLWGLGPALAVGRVVYLAGLGLAPWPSHPWGDGFSFAGALAGGAMGLAGLVLMRRRQSCEGSEPSHDCRHFVALAGAVVPGLTLAQALGWLGAAAHGVSAGVPLGPAAWWAPPLRDLYGVVLPRFPVQYLAVALSLVAWACMVGGRLGDRERIVCYAAVTGLGLTALMGHVERHQALIAGLSLDQALHLALGLAGLAYGLFCRFWRSALESA